MKRGKLKVFLLVQGAFTGIDFYHGDLPLQRKPRAFLMPRRYTSYSQNKNTYNSFKASQSDQLSPDEWVVRQVTAFGKWGGSKAKQLYWPGSL